MNKRGLSTTILVLIVVVVVAVLAFGTDLFKTTGQATKYTDGASYGPISEGYQNYINCKYLTRNDGWSVTSSEKIQYFDKTSGVIKESRDLCERTDRTVLEYHCEDGFGKQRYVICPPGTTCDEGACISE